MQPSCWGMWQQREPSSTVVLPARCYLVSYAFAADTPSRPEPARAAKGCELIHDALQQKVVVVQSPFACSLEP